MNNFLSKSLNSKVCLTMLKINSARKSYRDHTIMDTRGESRNVFYSWRCNLFEQSYNPKVIHTYRRPTETTRVVGFAKGNLLSGESSKTLKQDIPAAHLPHRGKSFGVCTELVERRLSKWERKTKARETKENVEIKEWLETARENEGPKALRCVLSLFGKKHDCLPVRRSFPIFVIASTECRNTNDGHVIKAET